MASWMTLLWIGLAGSIGAISRYLLSGAAYRLLGEHFPYGTLLVNVLGCFCLGMLAGWAGELFHPAAKPTLSVGFLGALTTFSTFGYETINYLEKGAWLFALANIGANLALGFFAVWLGLLVARQCGPAL
ncbi:fluoride efflux transporter CrcB [Lignipirellula cremea]|uniref:Fluoride-specific ion channel FluC n=1 Tax=Lignipirellula cremea TaxID=2528010 RepID=A0A518DME2_9BACT|nr:fluoride efflux transporter CrcB [Lignipirellula cremea]QDU92992.1 Putative fluoride ion transporter CrcB [Lignipirellula cremea]